MEPRIGVFICHCGTNIAGKVDVQAAAEFAKTLGNVVVSKDYKFMCSDPGQDMIKKMIQEHNLNRVVVAACSPRMHEPTFRKTNKEAGINQYLFQMANIREHCSWITEDPDKATTKAKALISGAIAKVRHLQPLDPKYVKIRPEVMIIGGGIGGIQAALDVANSGTKVYLVEKEQSIGGHMAQLDKTFPTLDCSACILTPKMVSVGQHPNIELLNYSEVEKVDGFIGNFKVTVRQKAKGVNYAKCTGCGICLEKCPIKVPNEFDEGLSKRRAIYTLFPQAVPNKPVIDRARCTYYIKGKCRACEKFCEPGAIELDQQDTLREIEVGTIIVAIGYKTLDVSAMKQLGYGKYPDVYTSLEFERLNNAAGPTDGKIVLKDGRTPQSVAILHCIGSRDENYHKYCSRVCCMYAVKFAHLLKEKLHADVYNFYIDLRCFGKGYEEFYKRTQEEGVKFFRGKAARVTDKAISDEEQGKLIVVAEETTLGRLMRVPVDMVILANALEPGADTEKIGKILSINRGQDGFFLEQHPKLAPVSTTTDGVFIAGACQGPKDIPDTVAQGSGAASQVLSLIAKGEVEVESATSWINPDLCSGCKICNLICPYGAISFDELKKISVINEVLCKGCGTCAATCPNGVISAKHFTDNQIMGEIEGVLVL